MIGGLFNKTLLLNATPLLRHRPLGNKEPRFIIEKSLTIPLVFIPNLEKFPTYDMGNRNEILPCVKKGTQYSTHCSRADNLFILIFFDSMNDLSRENFHYDFTSYWKKRHIRTFY